MYPKVLTGLLLLCKPYSMRQASAQEARRNFATLIEDVLRGEEIEVTRYGRTLARIVPADQTRARETLVAVARNFPLDMAAVKCPQCKAEAYPDDVGEAVEWILNHQCGKGNGEQS